MLTLPVFETDQFFQCIDLGKQFVKTAIDFFPKRHQCPKSIEQKQLLFFFQKTLMGMLARYAGKILGQGVQQCDGCQAPVDINPVTVVWRKSFCVSEVRRRFHTLRFSASLTNKAVILKPKKGLEFGTLCTGSDEFCGCPGA